MNILIRMLNINMVGVTSASLRLFRRLSEQTCHLWGPRFGPTSFWNHQDPLAFRDLQTYNCWGPQSLPQHKSFKCPQSFFALSFLEIICWLIYNSLKENRVWIPYFGGSRFQIWKSVSSLTRVYSQVSPLFGQIRIVLASCYSARPDRSNQLLFLWEWNTAPFR